MNGKDAAGVAIIDDIAEHAMPQLAGIWRSTNNRD
jgi:hypothetical protein